MGILNTHEQIDKEVAFNSHNKTENHFHIIPQPNYSLPHSTSPSFISPKNLTFTDESESFSTSSTVNNSGANQSLKLNQNLIVQDSKSFLPRCTSSNQMHGKASIHSIYESQNENINTVFIFDWDDTLIPTSFLSPHGYYNENKKLTKKELQKIAISEEYAYKILSKSIFKGAVYIITNSGPGWVEYSCKKYYPSIVPLLDKIKTISARGEYERQYPGDSKLWKLLAFSSMTNDFNKELITNIICVGDNIIEIEAGHTLSDHFFNAKIKTVKFREKPKLDELNKQLRLVYEQFNDIYSHKKNIKIRVEKKKKDGFSS